MPAIAFVNKSGGSVKTTTAVNVAVDLATYHGRQVTLIDADDQRDASHILGYTDPDSLEDQANFADVLAGDASIAEASLPALYREDPGEFKPIPNLSIVPGSKMLESAEQFLNDPTDRTFRAKDALEMAVQDDPNRVFILDGPGDMGIVTVNLLFAADGVVACVKPGTKEIRALDALEETMAKVNKRRRPAVPLVGVVIGDKPPKTHGHAYDDAATLAAEAYEDVILRPWVSRSVKIVEYYDAQCALAFYAERDPAARDYKAITEEMVKRGIFG
jgi:chromosome partitioning protein